MHVRHILAACAFALAALTAPTVAAQGCVGFTDVPAASTFCPSVEWINNRGITTGCTATLYCPNDAVTRIGMAAFLTRLGEKLTPAFLRTRDSGIGALNYAGQQVVCASNPVVVTGYPRTALVRGLLNLFTPDGGLDVKAWVVYSTDGGASWITPASNDGTAYGALYAGHTPPNDISLNPMNAIDLAVGSTYRFALAGIRTAGTGAIANTYCETLIQILNRNGTSSPLDPAGDPGPHGRGD